METLSDSKIELKPLSDSEIEVLVSAYAVGTKSGWHYLLTVAKNRALRFVSTEDAENIAQESAIALYTELKAGEDIQNLAGRIYTTAGFKSRDLLKKKDPVKLKKLPAKQREHDVEECDLLNSISYPNSIPPGLETKTDLASLTACLKDIKPPCSIVLTKYYYEDTSYKEIAAIIDIPPTQIGVRIKRCLGGLKDTVKEKYPLFFEELGEFFEQEPRIYYDAQQLKRKPLFD